MEVNTMKTIIATVAAAAVITAGASVAGAQELGGSTGGVSPYVGFEYTTTPAVTTRICSLIQPLVNGLAATLLLW